MAKLCQLDVKNDFVANISKEISGLIEQRLLPTNFTDAEIKEIHLDEIKSLIKYLAHFKSYDKAFDKDMVEEILELEIAQRYLTCPFFEMRIKGMKEFKQI